MKLVRGDKFTLNLKEAATDLYWWQYDYDSTRFYCMLFDLISKADTLNRERLEKAFPAHVMAHRLWRDSPNSDDFFKKFSLCVLTTE